MENLSEKSQLEKLVNLALQHGASKVLLIIRL